MEAEYKSGLAERNKANYLKAKELFNQNKIVECLRYYSPDHKLGSRKEQEDQDGIKRFFEELHQTWPGLQVVVENVVAEGNMVMGRSVASAVHSKPVLGKQPTNKIVVASFWDLHLFNSDGLIIESWNLIDNLAIMQQVGLLQDSREVIK